MGPGRVSVVKGFAKEPIHSSASGFGGASRWRRGEGKRGGVGKRFDCGISLPPHEAATVDAGNPRRFPRSTKWTKVMDDFIYGQLGALGVSSPRRRDFCRPRYTYSECDLVAVLKFIFPRIGCWVTAVAVG